MTSIENSKTGKELTLLRKVNEIILIWIERFNDLNNSTQDILKDANDIFHNHIIGYNFSRIEDLIIFDKLSEDVKIDYIDTSDEIMKEALEIFRKEAVVKNSKESHLIMYTFYYLLHYAKTSEKIVRNSVASIMNMFGIPYEQ